VLFVAAAGVLACLAVVTWSRSRKVDDSDLIPQYRSVPAESNALYTVLKATNQLYWPEAVEDKLDELRRGKTWDDRLATDVLARNHVCLAWFEQSLQQQFVAPRGEAMGVEDRDPHLAALRTISKLECLQTAKLFHDHKETEAFRLALNIIEFGHRIEGSGGDAMHYLVGAAIKAEGLSRIQQMTAGTTLPEPELIRIIRALDRFGPNGAGLTNTLKTEYEVESKLLASFAVGDWQGLGITNSPAQQIAISNEFRRTFSPEKTRAEFAQTTRMLLGWVPEPFCNTRWPEFSKAKMIGTAWVQWAVQGRHNGVGDSMFAMQVPHLKRLFERKSQEAVFVRATQLLLALKVYVRREGHLPVSLTALTPEFFRQVPTDDFDGKPIRYSPGKKLIYSVGPDLKDSGGQKRPGGDDVPFEIVF